MTMHSRFYYFHVGEKEIGISGRLHELSIITLLISERTGI